jgi:hypothetical protein
MKWEYRVEQYALLERWSGKRQADEVAKFVDELNALGSERWEMISFNVVPLKGAILGQEKGNLYLAFFKRQI